MGDRIFVYVDGESHFIRSEKEWKAIHGDVADLGMLHHGCIDDRMVLHIPEAKVFWTQRMHPGVDRITYFTSASGDEGELHGLNVRLRDFGLDPYIVHERSDLKNRRRNTLNQHGVIEKAKGVDIALAVRLLDDARHLAFQECHIYTSDVDFLPAIKSVRSQGRRVVVHGYKNGLSQHSELLHVPDRFIDLGERLREECSAMQSAETLPGRPD
jgi:uncharacterized LabA/DUF88 family protein